MEIECVGLNDMQGVWRGEDGIAGETKGLLKVCFATRPLRSDTFLPEVALVKPKH